MISAFLLLVTVSAFRDPVDPTTPWGVHGAYGAHPSSEFTVMWSTRALPGGPSLAVLEDGTTFTGEALPFSEDGNVQTMHRVRLTGLAPATQFSYRVGNGTIMSAPFSHKTQPVSWASAGFAPTLAIFGDMGISSNAQDTMPLLIADAESVSCSWTLGVDAKTKYAPPA